MEKIRIFLYDIITTNYCTIRFCNVGIEKNRTEASDIREKSFKENTYMYMAQYLIIKLMKGKNYLTMNSKCSFNGLIRWGEATEVRDRWQDLYSVVWF